MSIDVATTAMNRFGVGANAQTREHLAANASEQMHNIFPDITV